MADLHLADLHLIVSRSTFTIILALLFSLILLAIVGVVTRSWNLNSNSAADEKTIPPVVRRSKEDSTLFSKLSFKWDGLPVSLPVSFAVCDPQAISAAVGTTNPARLDVGVGAGIGAGFGVGVAVGLPSGAQSIKLNWQTRRQGPAFEHPLPAIYQQAPVSMAKMIMSRHTYRRPNPNRFQRSSSAPPSRRVQSMV